MKKIVTVIGARPQFVKAAVLSRLIKDRYSDKFREILVHTGQHYDKNMSDVFFNEMEIPKPDINLNIGSGNHGKMTGEMLAKIEEILLKEEPDYLLVYGDTNSTLAGALAASKLHIPVIHVEAGLRSFNMRMPEEQNRILTDHISSHLFCSTEAAVKNLKQEGITNGVHRTGDIMLDASLYYRKKTGLLDQSSKPDYFLMTLHRAENTDSPERLRSIVESVSNCGQKIILPIHPRTVKMLKRFNLEFGENVSLIEPVGFFEMLKLESECKGILTDSGGVQKESYFFKKPCITMRDETEWVETVESGWNRLVGADGEKIQRALNDLNSPCDWPPLYGTGNTGEQILNILTGDQL